MRFGIRSYDVQRKGPGVLFPRQEIKKVLAKVVICIVASLTVNTLHSRMDLSSDPDAIIAPSGLHDMDDIPAKWPSNVCISLPVKVSQTLTAPSAPKGGMVNTIARKWRDAMP